MTTSNDDFQEISPEITPSTLQTGPLWRNHNFLLLWSGQAISSLGTGISSLAMPLLILAVTGSPVQAGFVSALGALLYFTLGLPAGALVDRWDRKRVMILCNVTLALNMASIPIALVVGHLTIVQLYINSLITSACTVFLYVAEKAALPRVVPKQQLPTATAQYEVTESVVTLLSPSLGGIFYSIGRMVPFLADAVSYAFSACSLLFVKAKFQQERTGMTRKLSSEIHEGLAWLWRHPLMSSAKNMMGMRHVL